MPETHRALPEAMNCVEKAAACVAATRDLWRIANSQWNRKLQRIHRKTSLKWNDAAVLELDSLFNLQSFNSHECLSTRLSLWPSPCYDICVDLFHHLSQSYRSSFEEEEQILTDQISSLHHSPFRINWRCLYVLSHRDSHASQKVPFLQSLQ